ncbi:MAG: histidine kinase, partial [Bacteroidota bacterium]
MRFETPLTPHMRAGLVLGFAGILAAALVGHTALVLQLRGMVINMPTTVSNLMHGLSWAALGPAAVWLARRRPVAGRAWALNLLLHLVAATAANAAVGTLVSLANIPLRAGVPDAPSFEYLLAINFFSALLIYPLIWLGIVTATQAFDAVAEARQRRQRAAELEAQLVTSQLDALRAQLDPHFLFNTLNAISTLMGRDVTVARSVLADLAALLRRSLDQMGAPEVQLVDEIDFLKHYLAIEQARFEDRLQVELDVPAAL